MWAKDMQDILKRAKIHVTEGRRTDRYNGTSATLEEITAMNLLETNTKRQSRIQETQNPT